MGVRRLLDRDSGDPDLPHVAAVTMYPVPIPPDMVPDDVEHKVVVVGPKDLDDIEELPPVESLVLEDGYHVRVEVTEQDLYDLVNNRHLHLVFHSSKMPPFWIGTEEEAFRRGKRP